MTNWTAVMIGATVEVVVVVIGTTVHLPEDTMLATSFILLLIGFPSGYIVGTLAEGIWRVGAWHGLLSGSIGGGMLGTVLWYTIVTPDASNGVFTGLNRAIATSGILPNITATYEAQIRAILTISCVIVIAIEGTIAGGAAPGQQISLSPPDSC